jgi:hypothetical protein
LGRLAPTTELEGEGDDEVEQGRADGGAVRAHQYAAGGQKKGGAAKDEEIAAEHAAGTWFTPRWCLPCRERDDRGREEASRRIAASR